MNREQKLQFIKDVAKGKVTKDNLPLHKPDLSKLTVEELHTLRALQKKHERGTPLSDDERRSSDNLYQAIISRPPECGWYPKIKEWLAEGKSLKEIAGEMHIPWQDVEPVKKVIEYYEKHAL